MAKQRPCTLVQMQKKLGWKSSSISRRLASWPWGSHSEVGHLQSPWLAPLWIMENTSAVIQTKAVDASQPGALLQDGRYLKRCPSTSESLIINASCNSSNRIASTPEHLMAQGLAVTCSERGGGGGLKALSRHWTRVFHIFSERAKRGTPSPSSMMEMQSHPWSFSLPRQHHSNEFRSDLLLFWMDGTTLFLWIYCWHHPFLLCTCSRSLRLQFSGSGRPAPSDAPTLTSLQQLPCNRAAKKAELAIQSTYSMHATSQMSHDVLNTQPFKNNYGTSCCCAGWGAVMTIEVKTGLLARWWVNNKKSLCFNR